MSDEAPVPLAEQIAAVQEHVAYWKRRERWGNDDKGKAVLLGKFDDQISMWSAALATLQQHERAMACLGDVLYAIADMPEEDRCQAIDDALSFYNAACPGKQVELTPSPSIRQQYVSIVSEHERAMASLRVIADLNIPKHKLADLEFCRGTAVIAREQALAALDDAASAAGDAVTTEEDKDLGETRS